MAAQKKIWQHELPHEQREDYFTDEEFEYYTVYSHRPLVALHCTQLPPYPCKYTKWFFNCEGKVDFGPLTRSEGVDRV